MNFTDSKKNLFRIPAKCMSVKAVRPEIHFYAFFSMNQESVIIPGMPRTMDELKKMVFYGMLDLDVT
jgi:hypothetical protein